MVIDIETNNCLNPDLQLPSYNKNIFPSIKEKLTKKELQECSKFIEENKGKFKDRLQIQKKLQEHFNLTDCDISF